jgi:hypothetical protein
MPDGPNPYSLDRHFTPRSDLVATLPASPDSANAAEEEVPLVEEVLDAAVFGQVYTGRYTLDLSKIALAIRPGEVAKVPVYRRVNGRPPRCVAVARVDMWEGEVIVGWES